MTWLLLYLFVGLCIDWLNTRAQLRHGVDRRTHSLLSWTILVLGWLPLWILIVVKTWRAKP